MSASGVVSWVVGAAAAVGLAVGVGAVDVSGALPARAVAEPVAPAPADAADSFVAVSRPAPPSLGAANRPAGSPGTPVAGPGPATTSAADSSSPSPHASSASCEGGRRQRAIEADLAALGDFPHVEVDGRVSAADCAAFTAFQRRFGIRPARGQADATTADVAHRLAASPLSSCDAGAGVTACVDLTTQTAWVVRDGAVVFGPTVVRTGFRGHTTPVGTFRVNLRAKKEWSDPYSVWLPYWQRFEGGNGFHETTSYLHDKKRGSHGCVNLLHRDAVAMWDLLDTGVTVHTFGRRPGT